LLLGPTAAKGFDELDSGEQALAGKLRASAIGLQRSTVGVHHFEVAHDAGAITISSQLGRAAGVGHGAVLGRGLGRQMMQASQTILDFGEGDENPLAILGHGFRKRGLRALVVRPVAPAGKERQGKTRADGPYAVFPVEKVVELGADVTAGTGQAQDRKESGFGDADAGVGGGELALGFGNVRTAFEQVCGQAGGNGGRLRIPVRVGRASAAS